MKRRILVFIGYNCCSFYGEIDSSNTGIIEEARSQIRDLGLCHLGEKKKKRKGIKKT